MSFDNIPIPPVSKRRMSFIFAEKQKIDRTKSSLSFNNQNGRTEIPCSQIAALFIGRGTSITHDAVMLCGEMGVSILWTGDGAVRYYAHGDSIASRSTYAIRQAELVSKSSTRLKVVRQMYQMRFLDEVLEKNLTLQQLRGKEGTRVKRKYREISENYGIEWNSRKTKMSQISNDDLVNKGITMATSCLYGLTHSVICGIGALPSLGFLHTGHAQSFVFDIADLYKIDYAVETAFKIATDPVFSLTLDQSIRSEMRELFYKNRLATKIVDDIKSLFNIDEDDIDTEIEALFLWDNNESNILVPSGDNWSDKI